MFLEIVTPEATIFSGDVKSVSVPGIDGSFQMLNNHAPIVSALKQGLVTIDGEIEIDNHFKEMFTKKNNLTLFEIKSGAVELVNNKIILLID
ncbi:MAG: hypothetical protein CMC79_01725 [Flavobacteriaceae bacterium]|nr:hypothetical protein [Flavobacteriaceae bacterium]|tara:strand:+ start:461 stop:736 length:276 start_codon:yes stop_codon:yes gene_type:complete